MATASCTPTALSAPAATVDHKELSLPREPVKESRKRGGNPAPLGLLSFGMTTIMLCVVEAGWVEPGFVEQVSATAFFFGGVTQLIAGIFELIGGNTFSATVFAGYATFWLSFTFMFYNEKEATFVGPASFETGQTFFLAQWGVFTVCMLVMTLRKNHALQATLLFLAIAFFLLAAGVHDEEAKKAGGYFGLAAGCGACYMAFAEIFEETYGMTPPGMKALN